MTLPTKKARGKNEKKKIYYNCINSFINNTFVIMKKINTNSIIDGDKNGSHATPTALRESASPEETDVKTQEKDPPDTEKLSKPTHSPDVAYTA